MDLSLVIVNYNVKFFLEQCLKSVFASGKDLGMEVFVVDNNSVDGSVEMVAEKFPSVKLIANEENVGFSRANNQAIRIARGKYVLLLNPDTVLEDDTLTKVVAFMDKHPDAGGLGVKMLDGQGNFLPESKRGLPTPGVAFCKVFGLSALFPKSRTFGRYHLGFLDKDQTHQVDVLSGAFMLLRREALDKTGLLDEDFFMYGEDIDLSFRISRAGYRNYYYPGTRIIHYKGESTKKSSINYVLVFYNAMIIFARKHFSRKNARLFSLLINLAVYFRASIAIAGRFARRVFWPVLDAVLIYAGFSFIKDYWEHQVFMVETTYYPPLFMAAVVPAYILIWLISVYFSGGYDKPVKSFWIVRGIGLGTVAILVVYALLPLELRFSRALILLGSVWALAAMLLSRLFISLARGKGWNLGEKGQKRVLIAGDGKEATRIIQVLRQAGNTSFVGLASLKKHKPPGGEFLGTIAQINEIIEIYDIDEVIFCAGEMSSQSIIDHMSSLNMQGVDFKIAPPESMFIIGSNSIDTFEDLFAVNINAISKSANKRNKRLFDFLMASLMLVSLPVHLLLIPNRSGLVLNILSVIGGRKSWVGYYPGPAARTLPRIKPGVLYPGDGLKNKHLHPDTMHNLNGLYAKDYKMENDFRLVVKAYGKLGRRQVPNG
jgi:O-antigen biosynthesis protein